MRARFLFQPPRPLAGEGWGEGGSDTTMPIYLVLKTFFLLSVSVLNHPHPQPFSREREKGA